MKIRMTFSFTFCKSPGQQQVEEIMIRSDSTDVLEAFGKALEYVRSSVTTLAITSIKVDLF